MQIIYNYTFINAYEKQFSLNYLMNEFIEAILHVIMHAK